MSKERELLERAYYVLGELSYAMLKDSGEYNLAGDIYEFLSTPEPTQDEEPVGQVGKCHTVTWFKKPEPLTYLFTHPAPRPDFVRLSEEDIDRELIKNDYYSRSFTAGVRFAEKHHGIEKDVREETPD